VGSDGKQPIVNKLSKLTSRSYARGLKLLAESDSDLAQILEQHGTPPLWQREEGFPTLVKIILEQQVSLASAEAAFKKLLAIATPLTPARFLELDDITLKAAGFSRQKIIYGRHLAEAIVGGALDLDALRRKSDEDVRSELQKVKGIGLWTAEIYLLMALLRPDAWPVGDLALAIAVQELKRLPHRPGPLELEMLSKQWQPFRAIAARLFWSYYLNRPRRKSLPQRRKGAKTDAQKAFKIN
jgi:DNA-3-methyladenine glycosylase II